MTVITRTEPDDSERLRRSLSKEQGPTDEQRDASLGFGPRSRGFGQDQDPTSVSFPFLRRIAKDHGVAMGLHYTESPLLRAQWYISASDARAASFADNLIRPIYGSTVSAVLRFLWAGFSPAVKNTVAVNPSWTYVVDGEVKQVWPSTAVDALVYKPLKILAPEACRIVYDDNGAWNGIQWDEHYVGAGGFVISGRQRPNIDLTHSFWATLGAETVDGDPYGFARVAYCAPIFHMYRYIWTLLAHAFENSADPGPEVYFPKDENKDEDDETNRETALRIGKRKRSGSTVAIPSDVYEDFQNRTTNIPKWKIEYSDVKTEFAPIQEFLGYLETLKFRCVTADTLIDCPRDYIKHPHGVAISDLKPGQIVWTFNETERVFQLRPIKRSMQTLKQQDVYEVVLSNGQIIKATAAHPFLTTTDVLGWKRLDELQVGERLLNFKFDLDRYVKINPITGMGFGHPAKEYRHVAAAIFREDLDGNHVHHVDERHANSSSDNLRLMAHVDHLRLTQTGMRRSEETRAKIGAANTRKDMAERIVELQKIDDDLIYCYSATVEEVTELREERSEAIRDLLADGKTQREVAGLMGISKALVKKIVAGEDKGVGMKGRYVFSIRKCESCDRDYVPTGNRQMRCQACAFNNNFVSQREYHAGRRNKPLTWEDMADSVDVLSISFHSVQDVWDVEIDTDDDGCRNFVAGGVVLHNSLMMSEQSLSEGQGGSSSRNVAQVMSSQRDSAQASLMDLVIKVIMDQLVKPAMAINMPWYEGPLEMKTIGFGKEDNDVVRQMFQLAGQKDLSEFGIDLRRLADSRGFPMLDHAEQERMKQRMIAQANSTQTPAVEPTQGRRAIVTQSGFGEMVYHQLHDRIDLSSREDGDFVASLPRSATWEDRGILDAARELRGHLADAEKRSDQINLTDLVVDVQRCLYRAYDSALETTARALSVAPMERSSFTSEDLDRRSRAIVGELLDESRFDDASGLAVREIAAARNRAVVEVCMLDDVAVQVLEDGPERGRVVKPAEAIGLGEVRPLVKAPESLEIRRERLDGEHMARYDEDACVVLLSVDLPPEQEADFMIALGDRMAA